LAASNSKISGIGSNAITLPVSPTMSDSFVSAN